MEEAFETIAYSCLMMLTLFGTIFIVGIIIYFMGKLWESK